MGVHPESHPLQPDTDDGGVVADEVPRERVRVRVEEAREVEPVAQRRQRAVKGGGGGGDGGDSGGGDGDGGDGGGGDGQ